MALPFFPDFHVTSCNPQDWISMPARRLLLIINNLLREKSTAIFDSPDVAGDGDLVW